MDANTELMYWKSNEEWWTIIDDEFVLTDAAPQRAKDSFELWNAPKDQDVPYVR